MSVGTSSVDATVIITAADRRSSAAKRLLDIAVGVPLCIAVFPVVVMLAVYLMFRFRANPFFVHQRIGHGGRLISIPKLRTLPPDTHPYADKTLVPLEAPHRLTAFLRARHLDELPQLFLVPIGRLSLVGPRPRMEAEAQAHGDEHYNLVRTSVRQGCTGLWQVSDGARNRVSDHPEYDLLYVAQSTLLMDVWVLWRTFLQAVGGNPITLEEVPTWLLRDPQRAAYFAI